MPQRPTTHTALLSNSLIYSKPPLALRSLLWHGLHPNHGLNVMTMNNKYNINVASLDQCYAMPLVGRLIHADDDDDDVGAPPSPIMNEHHRLMILRLYVSVYHSTSATQLRTAHASHQSSSLTTIDPSPLLHNPT